MHAPQQLTFPYSFSTIFFMLTSFLRDVLVSCFESSSAPPLCSCATRWIDLK
jgi:hypothetical protein